MDWAAVGCWLDRYELDDRASEVLLCQITDRLRIKTLSGVASSSRIACMF